MGVLAGVDGRIDRDRPHGSCIAVTIAIIILTTIATGPDINTSKTVTTLKDFNFKFRFVLIRIKER